MNNDPTAPYAIRAYVVALAENPLNVLMAVLAGPMLVSFLWRVFHRERALDNLSVLVQLLQFGYVGYEMSKGAASSDMTDEQLLETAKGYPQLHMTLICVAVLMIVINATAPGQRRRVEYVCLGIMAGFLIIDSTFDLPWLLDLWPDRRDYAKALAFGNNSLHISGHVHTICIPVTLGVLAVALLYRMVTEGGFFDYLLVIFFSMGGAVLKVFVEPQEHRMVTVSVNDPDVDELLLTVTVAHVCLSALMFTVLFIIFPLKDALASGKPKTKTS